MTRVLPPRPPEGPAFILVSYISRIHLLSPALRASTDTDPTAPVSSWCAATCASPPPASADAEPSAVPGRSRTPPRGRTSLCKPTQGGDSRGSPWFLPSRLPAVHGTGETSRVAAKLAHATPSSHPRPRLDCCSHAARQRAGGRRRVCGEFGGWADPPGSATAPIHHPSTHIVSLSPLVPSRGAEVGARVS